MTIRSVEEDDKEDEVETQLDTQIFESQSPFEEDGTPQPQDPEAGRAVVRKRKPTISQTPDLPIVKRIRGTGASQISMALNNVAREFAQNREQKEIDRIEKLPAIERAIRVLRDKYPEQLAQLDVSGYTRLLENLQLKQALLSKAEVFLLMKERSDVQNLFVEELFLDVNSE
jgi:hypothetical protein